MLSRWLSGKNRWSQAVLQGNSHDFASYRPIPSTLAGPVGTRTHKEKEEEGEMEKEGKEEEEEEGEGSGGGRGNGRTGCVKGYSMAQVN